MVVNSPIKSLPKTLLSVNEEPVEPVIFNGGSDQSWSYNWRWNWDIGPVVVDIVSMRLIELKLNVLDQWGSNLNVKQVLCLYYKS